MSTDVEATEETALLSTSRLPRARTPLPKLQLFIILLIQISAPLASQSIYPYINQLISELDIAGGDEKKVGYYAGLIESLFFLTQAMTVLHWSRASDRIGRKVILMVGLFGSAASILCFGLSRTFWALVLSRCLNGLLNGNVGVMKSAVGDLTDRSNRATAFAFLPIVWAIGASVGPLIGGTLARPHDRFPRLFTWPFWQEFPYFLPCLVTGSFVLLCWLVVLFFFKETVTWKKPPFAERGDVISSPSADSPPTPPLRNTGPLPLRELLTFPVLISILNYVTLGFLNTTLGALLPLFFAMPIDIGGLGLTPPEIGVILSAYGIATGIFQVVFFARFVRAFGEKRVFVNGMLTCLPVFALFPIMSMIAQQYGVSFVVYGLIGCVLALDALMDTSFGAIFMFITASAPKSSRGTVNGLSQMSVAIARAVGPALGTSLFSLSVERDLMGGYFVYGVFFVLSCVALLLAVRLPDEIWDDIE